MRYKVQDMLEEGDQARQTVFEFFVQLVVGQYNSLAMMRPQLFLFISSRVDPSSLSI